MCRGTWSEIFVAMTDKSIKPLNSDALSPDLDAIVVGAGFAGLYMVQKLKQQGLSVRCFEAGSDVGGTWFWNKYPGAQCDVESLEYSYGFSEALQQDWQWSRRFAGQAEILAYANHVADRFELRQYIDFKTRVRCTTFDEKNGLWRVQVDVDQTFSARFLILGTGNLSTPQVPEIPGLNDFKGSWFHSSRWPDEGVDFAGKRVAVVGTGSTGIQIIPVVAETAQQLLVFQRSPNYVVPAQNMQLDEATVSAYKMRYPEIRQIAQQSRYGVADLAVPTKSALEVTFEEREQRYEELWKFGSHTAFLTAFNDLLLDLEANETAADFVRRKILATVADHRTAEVLSAFDHPLGARRLCAGTEYYETFNRPNVTLVSVREEPIETFTEKGLCCGGVEHEFDIVVFATGFDAMTGALREIRIQGRDGLLLADKWSAGPLTYLGMTVSGFPNMFIITGPGSPSVKSNVILSIEQHVDWIAGCLSNMRVLGTNLIEAQPAAETDWIKHVNEVAAPTLYVKANAWYTGANVPGKPRVFMPYVGGIGTYRRICDEIAQDSYRGFSLASVTAPVALPAQQPAVSSN